MFFHIGNIFQQPGDHTGCHRLCRGLRPYHRHRWHCAVIGPGAPGASACMLIVPQRRFKVDSSYQLTFIHFTIETVESHQFLVGAFLDDMAVFKDKDEIGILNDGQTMGDDKSGPSLDQFVRALRIRCSVEASTLEVESSRISIRGSTSRDRAMTMRCFSPPDSVTPRSPTQVS